MIVLDFGNGITVKDSAIHQCALEVITTIINEIPEESRCSKVINCILDESKNLISYMPITSFPQCPVGQKK